MSLLNIPIKHKTKAVFLDSFFLVWLKFILDYYDGHRSFKIKLKQGNNMFNLSKFVSGTAYMAIPAGLLTGAAAFLLSGNKKFNVQLIAPNISFSKGALIGGSMIIVGRFVDEIARNLLVRIMTEENKNHLNTLRVVLILGAVNAVPLYLYGRSSPLTVISFFVISILGSTCGTKIQKKFLSAKKNISI